MSPTPAEASTNPPEPPFPTGLYYTNPTSGNEVPGNGGYIADHHTTPGTFPNPLSPLGTTQFGASQYYYYRCSCQSGGANIQIYPSSGTVTILRSVNVTSSTSGVLTVTKTNVTAIPPATKNVP